MGQVISFYRHFKQFSAYRQNEDIIYRIKIFCLVTADHQRPFLTNVGIRSCCTICLMCKEGLQCSIFSTRGTHLHFVLRWVVYLIRLTQLEEILSGSLFPAIALVLLKHTLACYFETNITYICKQFSHRDSSLTMISKT